MFLLRSWLVFGLVFFCFSFAWGCWEFVASSPVDTCYGEYCNIISGGEPARCSDDGRWIEFCHYEYYPITRFYVGGREYSDRFVDARVFCPAGTRCGCSNGNPLDACYSVLDCMPYDPCEDVACDSYCDGDVFYSNGRCEGGVCVYDVLDCNSLNYVGGGGRYCSGLEVWAHDKLFDHSCSDGCVFNDWFWVNPVFVESCSDACAGGSCLAGAGVDLSSVFLCSGFLNDSCILAREGFFNESVFVVFDLLNVNSLANLSFSVNSVFLDSFLVNDSGTVVWGFTPDFAGGALVSVSVSDLFLNSSHDYSLVSFEVLNDSSNFSSIVFPFDYAPGSKFGGGSSSDVPPAPLVPLVGVGLLGLAGAGFVFLKGKSSFLGLFSSCLSEGVLSACRASGLSAREVLDFGADRFMRFFKEFGGLSKFFLLLDDPERTAELLSLLDPVFHERVLLGLIDGRISLSDLEFLVGLDLVGLDFDGFLVLLPFLRGHVLPEDLKSFCEDFKDLDLSYFRGVDLVGFGLSKFLDLHGSYSNEVLKLIVQLGDDRVLALLVGLGEGDRLALLFDLLNDGITVDQVLSFGLERFLALVRFHGFLYAKKALVDELMPRFVDEDDEDLYENTTEETILTDEVPFIANSWITPYSAVSNSVFEFDISGLEFVPDTSEGIGFLKDRIEFLKEYVNKSDGVFTEFELDFLAVLISSIHDKLGDLEFLVYEDHFSQGTYFPVSNVDLFASERERFIKLRGEFFSAYYSLIDKIDPDLRVLGVLDGLSLAGAGFDFFTGGVAGLPLDLASGGYHVFYDLKHGDSDAALVDLGFTALSAAPVVSPSLVRKAASKLGVSASDVSSVLSSLNRFDRFHLSEGLHALSKFNKNLVRSVDFPSKNFNVVFENLGSGLMSVSKRVSVVKELVSNPDLFSYAERVGSDVFSRIAKFMSVSDLSVFCNQHFHVSFHKSLLGVSDDIFNNVLYRFRHVDVNLIDSVVDKVRLRTGKNIGFFRELEFNFGRGSSYNDINQVISLDVTAPGGVRSLYHEIGHWVDDMVSFDGAGLGNVKGIKGFSAETILNVRAEATIHSLFGDEYAQVFKQAVNSIKSNNFDPNVLRDIHFVAGKLGLSDVQSSLKAYALSSNSQNVLNKVWNGVVNNFR